jgi:hypothetical protein
MVKKIIAVNNHHRDYTILQLLTDFQEDNRTGSIAFQSLAKHYKTADGVQGRSGVNNLSILP